MRLMRVLLIGLIVVMMGGCAVMDKYVCLGQEPLDCTMGVINNAVLATVTK